MKESEGAVKSDRACLEEDSKATVTRANYLKQFRDKNKQVCENLLTNMSKFYIPHFISYNVSSPGEGPCIYQFNYSFE